VRERVAALPEMPEILRPIKAAWWYVKEISGENAYDRYLTVHTSTHPDRQPMGRGEFYRRQQNDKYNNPGSRCP